MEAYKQYEIDTVSEILVAQLSILPFEAFEERETTTIAYIRSAEWSEMLDQEVREICSLHEAKCKLTNIEPRNWNEEWESNFEPVDVGQFCTIRADFHEKLDGFAHTIRLQPKMAFGTGHHETTYMMIHAMSDIKVSESNVLDYGCGTGILAVLSVMMGADSVVAVDIEEESYLNTQENAKANAVELDQTIHGTIEDVSGHYDIILANINRNVLLATAEAIYERLSMGGTLLMSGILQADLEKVVHTYQELGLQLADQHQRGNWCCLHWQKG